MCVCVGRRGVARRTVGRQVRDLLRPGAAHSDKHAIVHTADGLSEVSGAVREPVDSVAAAHREWRKGRGSLY